MDIDVTILIQAGIILVLFFTLNGLLFQPILEVFEARHKKLEGARGEIDKLTALKADDLDAYQVRIRKAADEACGKREERREEGRAKERELLSQVRAEIADSLNAARGKIDLQEGEARQSLSAQVDALGGEMASKILGREVGA